MTSGGHKRTGVVLALLLLTLAVYWPVCRYPFAGLDDDVVITHNPWVNGGLSLVGLRWAATTLAGTMWFPLTWISYMADVQFFGAGAGSHHLANLLIHATNSILLFLTLNALTGSRWKSAFVSAMFAVHPLHAESVVWITERKDVLSGLFWMITLATYQWYVHRPRLGRYLALLGIFVLGLMAKPMLVTLPFVLLLLDYWPLGRFRGGKGMAPGALPNRIRELFAEKLPLLAVAAGFSLLTIITQNRGGAISSLDAVPFWARLANAVVSYAWYVRKTVVPTALAIYYPHPGTAIGTGEIIAATLFAGAVTWFVLRSSTVRPALAVGWLWYLGTLIPTLGLVQVGAYARADRFTYLPLIGLFILVAWDAPFLLTRKFRYVSLLPWMGGALTLLMAVACSIQVGYWRDDETLFGHALAVTQRNWMVHCNLGATLMEMGKLEEARNEFQEALRINPNFELARLNLGQTLSRLGKDNEAEGQFLAVLRQNPDDGKAHFSLGRHLADKGRLDEALLHLNTAIRLEPDFAAAHEALGQVLSERGDGELAIAALSRALQLQPDLAAARTALGWALMKAGRSAEALDRFRVVLAVQPDSAEALTGAGAALGEAGRFDEATASLQAALRLDPGAPEIHNNLAIVFQRMGRQEAADREWQEAVRLQRERK